MNTRTRPRLPPELWLKIAEHGNYAALWSLRRVNRRLCSIVAYERHRRLQIPQRKAQYVHAQPLPEDFLTAVFVSACRGELDFIRAVFAGRPPMLDEMYSSIIYNNVLMGAIAGRETAVVNWVHAQKDCTQHITEHAVNLCNNGNVDQLRWMFENWPDENSMY